MSRLGERPLRYFCYSQILFSVCRYWIIVLVAPCPLILLSLFIAKQPVIGVKNAEGDIKNVLLGADISLINYL